MKTLLDPRNYRWVQRDNRKSPFAGMLSTEKLPVSLGEVFFDRTFFQDMDGFRNGVCFSYWSYCSVTEYSAVQLDNGSILFCLMNGHSFGGTDHDDDEVSMEYYDVYALTPPSK